MIITVKPSTGTTAGTKYATTIAMIREQNTEEWSGNVCTITRTKVIDWVRIKDDSAATKMIDGKDILTVEKDA